MIDGAFTPPLPSAAAEQEWLSGLLDFAIEVNSGLDASWVTALGYVEDCLNLELLIGHREHRVSDVVECPEP